MKRRLNLAAALVHSPRILLLDEPTAGVDLQSREYIFEIIRHLREAGTAILYTTHYMEEAEGLCDRLGIMNQGKLVAMGTLDALLANLECRETIELRGLPLGTDFAALEAAGGVSRVERTDGIVRLFVRSATHLLEPLQKIISRSRQPVHLKIAPISLEHLFLRLTDYGASRLTRVKLIALAVWLCLVAPVSAASPLEYTRATLEQARAIVGGDQTHNDKLAALSSLFRNFLDTDTMGRAALGKHWSSFTPQQQKDFLVLFRQLFQRTYVQELLLFEKPNFVYVGETSQHGEASVNTKIVTPRDEFSVVYQLRPEGEHWLVTRITVEDVSLTANLGSQLDHLLSRDSVEDVLNLMQRKYGSSGGGA